MLLVYDGSESMTEKRVTCEIAVEKLDPRVVVVRVIVVTWYWPPSNVFYIFFSQTWQH